MDPYSLLNIDWQATDKQITSAYRKLSIKLHPDKNPDDPNAADKFHELNQAYQKLIDPVQRLTLDQEVRKKKERETRYAQFDSKRKRMQEELEQREEAFKKSKLGAVDKKKREQETDRIKEEGRRMRAEAIAKAEQEEAARTAAAAPPEPASDKLDTTVRFKYTLSTHPGLDSKSALATHLKENRFTNFDERTIVLSLRPAKGKKSKNKDNDRAVPMNATGLIPFNTVMDAFTIVCASGSEKRGLKDVQITWASGSEPAVVANLKNHSGTPAQNQPKTFSFSSPAPQQSTVPGLDFESATLMRLRQAERERLEREIRKQEADES